MPKAHRHQPPPETCSSIPVESPVPGVGIELASLLVHAIKARRKFLSKSSQTKADDEDEETRRRRTIRDLEENAEDKKSAFLNELRRQVERSSASASEAPSRRDAVNSSSNASTNCLRFLLQVLADGSNSVYLRRSSLALTREILEKSSDSRAFLASGRHLLDFVSVIEGIGHDGVEQDESREESTDNASPKSTFQLEAMDLVHSLASRFGKFYTQFTVASRLLGDVSVNFSMHNSIQTPRNNDSQEEGTYNSRRVNMKMLRRERDKALEHGPKACKSLGRMIERADGYFRILVPRFGGFNTESPKENDDDQETTVEDGSNALDNNGFDHDGDGDDGSIDWEEGDICLDSGNLNENARDATSSDCFGDGPNIDHQTAVEQTMNVMGRGGALLDGTLDIKVGVESLGAESTQFTAPADSTLDSATASQSTDRHEEARLKLQKLVDKFSTRQLPHVNRWIHALSLSDGMEEREVANPATAATSGNKGPVSLVLLSEEKRFMRRELLPRLLKMREEVRGVVRSAATLGITPEGADKKKDDDGSTARPLEHVGKEGPPNDGTDGKHTNDLAEKMPGALAVAGTKRKLKTSRFKVIYRKK